MEFEYFGVTHIVFGTGKISQVGTLAKSFGKKGFIVTGSGSLDANQVLTALSEQGITWSQFKVSGEPSIYLAEEASRQAREENCDFVIGFGGGSVIDCAKAVSAMITNNGSLLDYLEVVGKNLPLQKPGAPVIAIPSTSGTGSEATRNSVLSVPEEKVKVSLRSVNIIPRVALVDPLLTVSVPPAVTASSGMDAFTQLLESYLTPRSNILTDHLVLAGIERVSRSLLKAYQNGKDIPARVDMAMGSMLSGITLTNAGLGAVHGFAGPIGGLFNAPHGLICASLLPAVVRANIKIARDSGEHHLVISRFEVISRIITGDSLATTGDGLSWIESLATSLNIPGLSSMGITPENFDLIIDKSIRSSSMKGNPVQLSRQDLYKILEESL